MLDWCDISESLLIEIKCFYHAAAAVLIALQHVVHYTIICNATVTNVSQ